VNGSVLVPYLLEVAFKVSSFGGMNFLLNPVELMVYYLPSKMSGLNTSLDYSVNLF
jgi:hypothetical protein